MANIKFYEKEMKIYCILFDIVDKTKDKIFFNSNDLHYMITLLIVGQLFDIFSKTHQNYITKELDITALIKVF